MITATQPRPTRPPQALTERRTPGGPCLYFQCPPPPGFSLGSCLLRAPGGLCHRSRYTASRRGGAVFPPGFRSHRCSSQDGAPHHPLCVGRGHLWSLSGPVPRPGDTGGRRGALWKAAGSPCLHSGLSTLLWVHRAPLTGTLHAPPGRLADPAAPGCPASRDSGARGVAGGLGYRGCPTEGDSWSC